MSAALPSNHKLARHSDFVPTMSRTTFFTAADRRYEMFVLPYIVSTLAHNADARVEVCLQDVNAFRSRNERALHILGEYFGEDRTLLRSTRWTGIPPNSVRFLETPKKITEFTYIGDIDILVLEAITDIHIERMNRHGLPYSNEIRSGRQALSGLHFTRSDAYYPITLPDDVDPRRDEELLYALVTARGWGTPPKGMLRGVHGYHMSPKRSPLSALVRGKRTLDWGLSKPKHFNAYRDLIRSPVWQRLVPYFDSQYRLLLGLMDLGVAQHHPEYRPSDDQVESLLTNADLVRSIVQSDVSPRAPPPTPQADDVRHMISELKLRLGELQNGARGVGDALEAERQRAAVAEQRAVDTERNATHQAELATLRARASSLERENEALRQTFQALPSLLDKARQRLADAKVRLSLLSNSRKSLRGELRRRGRLLGRVRSELHAAKKRTVELRRRIRTLERDRQTLRVESAQSKSVLVETNRRLERLRDHLNDGLHAVVASRRWRWGGVLTLPRQMLGRVKSPTAPETMLRLLSEHGTSGPRMQASRPASTSIEANRSSRSHVLKNATRAA